MNQTLDTVTTPLALQLPAAPPATLPGEPEPPDGRVGEPTEGFDRWLHAQIGHHTAGVSPAALLLATTDWLAHLALSPAKQAELVHKAWRKAQRLALYLPHAQQPGAPCCIEPLPQDRRFDDPAWREWPYNLISQAFLLQQQWWHNATTEVRGVSRHHEEVVTFIARQLLDIVSPANFVATNPVVWQRTLATMGANLAQGALHWWDDWERQQAGRPAAGSEAFQVGVNLAVTPGQVVQRNSLAELIQYRPTTAKVHPEPVFIVPAWIMKYYVLDLQPQASLIKHLVDQGHTVFCLSWKNPAPSDRDHGMEDYLRLGLFDALDAINAICPKRKVHAVGYCLGGTLLAIGAAAMARDSDDRLASLTLLAAQTDFSEPGEIGLFIDDSEVSFLEDIMQDRGYLTRGQMAGAFQLLRSNDLVWSRGVRDYLMGERAPFNALMAWNADATRMPFRMHSEYLRGLFLRNDLAAARFRVGGRPVALADLDLPIFCLGTETDHVAPWRSVYKIQLLTECETTFVLTNGGHNAGVVSPPGHPRRHYRLRKSPADGKYIDPELYLADAEQHEGSWWTAWSAWLAARSGTPVKPPAMGAPSRGYVPLGEAPGRYVLAH
ncbi:PHA/PHB synthase family protein [Ideonella sp.]|uniref:PHA/PHB synthase family protein n=1 Tax=Ideonella sp. TaxID=1929293 RepID=UPI002B460806|nr:alpha/beta fold hydrolase [Ideonella sp.]HJV71574.1 alpha/beta fold hydrolase [Ideonella sp.]